ncbi:hypothetical protein predicted by Glimmer/Critica [Sorangium cellulosum So ce56]|uniref:Uncharacterized protein n=2 Tax=Polyangiaceae TaxID=49 RepID=A9ENG5_SORC5|nr:hypothetical protein predicted by Glimmer/Critica [Sorangium cellulosum So ce56]
MQQSRPGYDRPLAEGRRLPMSRIGRCAFRGLAAAAASLAFGCVPGLANLHADIREEVARARRMFDLCQDIGQVESASWTRSRPFLGADRMAVERVITTLTGKAGDFDPLQDVERQLREVQRLAREIPSRGGDPVVLNDTTRSIEVVVRLRAHWSEAERQFQSLRDQLFSKAARVDIIHDLNACAERDLRRTKTGTRESCDIRGVSNLVGWAAAQKSNLETTSTSLQADLDALTRVSRALLLDINHLRESADSADTSPIPLRVQVTSALPGSPSRVGTVVAPEVADLLEQTNFAVRELTALGGLVRDGLSAIERIGTITDGKSAVEAIGRTLLDAEADRVADRLLLSLERAVARVDRAIDKLDEETYGAASQLVSLGLTSGVVEQAVCAVGKEAKVGLAQAGLSPGSLGARLCKAAVGSAKDFPPSPILARVYEGLIGAAAELPCAKALAVDDPTNASDEGFRREPAPLFWPDAKGPVHTTERNAKHGGPKDADPREPERLARAIEALARATWKARVQVAESALARVIRPYQFGEHTMPRLRDVPPLLGATLLLVEERERDLLRRYEGQPFSQFFLAQEFVLATRWADEPGIYNVVCRDQMDAASAAVGHRVTLLPMPCSTLREDSRPPAPSGMSSVEDAIRQVAWELCASNAKMDQRAEVEELCAVVSDSRDMDQARADARQPLSPVYCRPAGYGAAVISPAFDLCALQFATAEPASSSKLVNNCKDAIASMNRARAGIATAAQRLGQVLAGSSKDTYIQFVGRASAETVNNASDFIKYALQAQSKEVRSACKTKDKGKSKFDLAATLRAGNATLIDALVGIITDSAMNDARDCGRHDDMDAVFENGNSSAVAGKFKISSYSTGATPLGHENWLMAFLRDARTEARYLARIATPTSQKAKTDALSELANEILSIFRAVGAAHVALEHAETLCDRATCVATALGELSSVSLETGKDQSIWRSTSIVVSRKEEPPTCHHLRHPAGIRVDAPPEETMP